MAPYLAHIPTYPSGLWSFTFASQTVDPLTSELRANPALLAELKYLNAGVCKAAFALPNYIRANLAK